MFGNHGNSFLCLQQLNCYFTWGFKALVMQVKVLFLVVMDLCRRTSGLQHPLPVSQVGSSNIQVRLHYIDGNYTVLPEVVEASLGPHMQVTFCFLFSQAWCIISTSLRCHSIHDLKIWCKNDRNEWNRDRKGLGCLKLACCFSFNHKAHCYRSCRNS
jgi:hypothetical protein